VSGDIFLFNYTPLPWFVLTQVFWDVFVGVCVIKVTPSVSHAKRCVCVKEATVAWSILTQVFWDVFVGVCVCDQRWLPAWQAVITVACHLNTLCAYMLGAWHSKYGSAGYISKRLPLIVSI